MRISRYTLLFIMHVICAVVAMVLVTNYLVLGPKPIIKQGDGSKVGDASVFSAVVLC